MSPSAKRSHSLEEDRNVKRLCVGTKKDFNYENIPLKIKQEKLDDKYSQKLYTPNHSHQPPSIKFEPVTIKKESSNDNLTKSKRKSSLKDCKNDYDQDQSNLNVREYTYLPKYTPAHVIPEKVNHNEYSPTKPTYDGRKSIKQEKIDKDYERYTQNNKKEESVSSRKIKFEPCNEEYDPVKNTLISSDYINTYTPAKDCSNSNEYDPVKNNLISSDYINIYKPKKETYISNEYDPVENNSISSQYHNTYRINKETSNEYDPTTNNGYINTVKCSKYGMLDSEYKPSPSVANNSCEEYNPSTYTSNNSETCEVYDSSYQNETSREQRNMLEDSDIMPYLDTPFISNKGESSSSKKDNLISSKKSHSNSSKKSLSSSSKKSHSSSSKKSHSSSSKKSNSNSLEKSNSNSSKKSNSNSSKKSNSSSSKKNYLKSSDKDKSNSLKKNDSRSSNKNDSRSKKIHSSSSKKVNSSSSKKDITSSDTKYDSISDKKDMQYISTKGKIENYDDHNKYSPQLSVDHKDNIFSILSKNEKVYDTNNLQISRLQKSANKKYLNIKHSSRHDKSGEDILNKQSNSKQIFSDIPSTSKKYYNSTVNDDVKNDQDENDVDVKSWESGDDCQNNTVSFGDLLSSFNVKPVKKKKLSKQSFSQSVLNDINKKLLSDINPNYYPLPSILAHKKNKCSTVDDVDTTNKHVYQRTMVYSGKRQRFVDSVPRLYDACLKILSENINHLEYVGGVPYEILEPILKKCSSEQLFRIEEFNPIFVKDSDNLWKTFCKNTFPTAGKKQRETFRDLYMRKYDERQNKFKSLTKSIKKNMNTKAAPVRKTQMAFVDSSVKPPRTVRRAQIRNGTAGSMDHVDKLERLSSHGGKKSFSSRNIIPVTDSIGYERRYTKKLAPLMEKTCKLIKSKHYRR